MVRRGRKCSTLFQVEESCSTKLVWNTLGTLSGTIRENPSFGHEYVFRYRFPFFFASDHVPAVVKPLEHVSSIQNKMRGTWNTWNTVWKLQLSRRDLLDAIRGHNSSDKVFSPFVPRGTSFGTWNKVCVPAESECLSGNRIGVPQLSDYSQ